MSIVSVDELQNYMSSAHFNDVEAISAQFILDGLQSQLENYLNRTIEPTLVQERVLAESQGTYAANYELRLRFTPVIKLISITDDLGNAVPINTTNGVASDPLVPALTEDEFDNYDDLNVTRQVDYIPGTFYGSSVLGYGNFQNTGVLILPTGFSTGWYAAKYIAGLLAPDFADVRLSIMRAANREMTFDHDDTIAMAAGAYTNPGTLPAIIGFTDAELAALDRLRRRTVV